MDIDKKRVLRLAACIAGISVLVMLIPSALDNNRRYKVAQSLQIQERTLQYSTPATKDEQQAIIKVILKDTLMPSPDGLQTPSQLHKLLLLEPTVFCSDFKFEHKLEESKNLPWFDSETCSHGLLTARDAYIDTVWPKDTIYLGLVSDMFKVNRVEWLNPSIESDGLVFLNKEKIKAHKVSLECAVKKECWESIQNKISGVRQYIRFSRAVISKNQHSAVVYMDVYTPFVSRGGIVYLKLINGAWKMDGGRVAWRAHNWH